MGIVAREKWAMLVYARDSSEDGEKERIRLTKLRKGIFWCLSDLNLHNFGFISSYLGRN